MKRRVGVYALRERILVQPTSATVDGIWIDSDMFKVLGSQVSTSEIGEEVLHACLHSQQNVAAPLDMKALGLRLVRRTGAKSLRDLYANGSYVSVSVEEGESSVKLVPGTKRVGQSGFFFDEGAITLDSRNPEQLGAKIAGLLRR